MEYLIPLLGSGVIAALITVLGNRRAAKAQAESTLSHAVLEWARELNAEIKSLKAEITNLRAENAELAQHVQKLQQLLKA